MSDLRGLGQVHPPASHPCTSESSLPFSLWYSGTSHIRPVINHLSSAEASRLIISLSHRPLMLP